MPTRPEPLRAELFSAEQLEQFAGTLAARQTCYPGKRRGRHLLPRLRENARSLVRSHLAIAEAGRQTRTVSPAAEWLLNNFHVVEEQVREIQEDLPPGFYRELPKLSSGELEGYPRVYGLAWAFVAHTDSRIELDTFRVFVRAYQRVQALTIGELWALAISLRVVLVENLRRLSERVAARSRARDDADRIADVLLGAADGPKPAPAEVIQMLEAVPFSRAFAVQLVQRLREQDPAVTPALDWLDRRLARESTTADELVHVEHQEQIANHATVRNVITSMRLLSQADWADFFESVSLVHMELCDGTRVAEMDFPTRDRYRHAVEELARGCGHDELEVARRAVRMAADAAPHAEPRHGDPGYYLIAKGRAALERDLDYRVPVGQWLRRAWVRAAAPLFLGAIVLATIAIVSVPAALMLSAGASARAVAALALLGLFPASDLAIALIHRFITRLMGPRRLPKLELAQGIPAPLRTLVAIPMLLTDEEEIEEVAGRLEVHALANSDPELRFALLSDWADAARESEPEDPELLARARAAIAALNARHGPASGGGDRFWVLHRGRLWNANEGVWMGWERKRGKLRELNRLLRGATDTSFLPPDPGAAPAPSGIRYVITLDADSRLPREAARQLVGTIAHPLNLPGFDAAASRVVEGHALLQPRVTPTLPEAGWGTLFQLVFSGPRGIDLYAFAVSDVYQDLFGEGIYTGKGIYDVDAFERALDDRVPENTQLSHDLFEGLFARAGFVSDVELFEGFPAAYEVAASRQHRWVRGDWQLLRWILGLPPSVPGPPGNDAIPAIARWKMLDNLRRSLSPPATFALLVTAWCLPGAGAGWWTVFVLGVYALPTLLSFFGSLLPKRRGVAKRSFLRGIAADLAIGLAQAALRLTLLAHAAWLRADAIGRTLWRVCVSRRHMLEWTPAAQAHRALDLKVGGIYLRMRGALVLAAGAAALLGASGSRAWGLAAPFLAAWALSPFVAWWVSQPPRPAASARVSEATATEFREIARRTWAYFERFAGGEFHGLPADNFQEEPQPEVARRTSPTNVGLGLLATVAANDFGWIGMVEMAERLEAALSAIGRLELFRGHLYNWYGTTDLAPLEPRYVSTVDSGNLAAHLIVLKQACLERAAAPVLSHRALEGIGDTLALVRGAAAALAPGSSARVVTSRQLEAALGEARALLAPVPATAAEWASRLAALAVCAETLVDIVRALGDDGSPEAGPALAWSVALRAAIASHARDVRATGESLQPAEPLAARLAALAHEADRLFAGMDFTFLYDSPRDLFAIGFRPVEGTLDSGHYDLLASEARLASFVAIARGDVPVEHWFHLGRPLTPVGRGSALLSWSGSMFEYLMPDLVLDAPSGSLLEHTNRLIVRRQIGYGQERGVPWGISEAAYNARDMNFTYQYSNFGVSGLGLKRGLSEDIVVAPYATALAAMVDPAAAGENFRRLASVGALGHYGFYESIDYTASRLPEEETHEVVKAYMAHHQGMTIVSLANVLLDETMRRRFRAEPAVQATELLLQERTPTTVTVARTVSEDARRDLHVQDEVPPVLRRFRSPHDPMPRTHILSNGRYSVMMTAAGSGYSRWRGLDVTRWREDATRDPWGTYLFLADATSGKVWSAGYQPAGVEPDAYEAVYSEDRIEIHRTDGPITTSLQVVVSTEDDAEIRHVSLTNRGTRPREIEMTSYAEIVLAPPAADAAHPAFSNLFVVTEFAASLEALVAGRRPRDREPPVWAAQVLTVEGEVVGTVQYETDRARFLGRGRTVRDPISIAERRPLSNTAGTVLDPVFSLRRRVRLAPGATVRVHLATVVADSREAVLALAAKYRDPATFERVSSLAWTQAQVQLRHLGITTDEAHLFQQLAARVLYSDAALRAPVETLARCRRGPSALWGHGISGDVPIVLVRIDQVEDQGIVRQLLRAHEYWKMKGLAVDLVIVNEQPPTYSPELGATLESLVRAGSRAPLAGEPSIGRIFVLRGGLASPEDRDALAAAARVVLLSRQGTLAQQVIRLLRRVPAARAAQPVAARPPAVPLPPPRIPLEFFNGLGGFAEDSGEYVTLLGERQWTPAPWINVLANASFGCLVSEAGSGYTWAVNSRENQLTPWSNDPVSDPPGEAVFLRDEETGEVWSPTALPIRGDGSYVVRHGQGYSRFEYEHRGIATDLTVFVGPQDPVKISRLRVENRSASARTLTVTAYAEWVLGPQRSVGAPFVVTELDSETGALFARNAWNEAQAGRVAFFDVGGRPDAWTADRAEFLGRNGTLEAPAGLARGAILSRRTGAGLDPCAALQLRLRLQPGQSAQVVVLLGQGRDADEARQLVARNRQDPEAALAVVRRGWEDTLTALQVRTPDRSMDLMLNRWLLYQTLGCRFEARAAFYQAGGAWGFRDQLQDAMSFTVARRELTREQLLRAASRQFEQGDVQHWWHDPEGKGVRTRISDDLLWLPYATHHYLEITGDHGVLDEPVPFLAAPPLEPGEIDRYFEPKESPQKASLFEHCARAIDRSLAVGRHGLPLMGAGDWNDGMNRVGAGGQGESVWLGWFLSVNLGQFAALADARGERDRATAWRAHADALKFALERDGWDGDWYRRAYFDDGTPLGSAKNDECRIDSIAQSWAVISGAADPERGQRAMAAVDEHLIRRGDGLVLLFTPPFDRTALEPGYIKGYAPGVRENGGQYTHAAVWAMIAFAALGDGDKAGELFAILNPINHASTRSGLYRYRVEPYVMAGDVYSEPPHAGRGGWTWYTGAAGWMYRAGVEWILGFRLRGTVLHVDPCIPRAWPGYEIGFRYHSARYRLSVENPRGAMRGVTSILLDGGPVSGREIPLADDGREHRIDVVLG